MNTPRTDEIENLRLHNELTDAEVFDKFRQLETEVQELRAALEPIAERGEISAEIIAKARAALAKVPK